MAEERDAFGRAAGDSPPFAPPRRASTAAGPAPHAASGGATASAGRSEGRPEAALRWPAHRALALLFVLVGVAAVIGTLRYAIDRGRDEPAAVSFALERDPFGPRSLLRPAPMRRALGRARNELRPGEHAVALSAAPDRLTLTVVDAREQTRWVTGTASGAIRTTDLSTTTAAPALDLAALDVGPGLRAAARRFRQLRPYAADPTMVLVTDGRNAPTGWSFSVTGVREAERTTRFDLRGHRR